MRLTYAAVLLACLAATLPLELLMHTRVYARWRRWLLAIAPAFVVFVGWDLYAVAAGHWCFAPGRVLGLLLPGGLPVEEVAFFVVIPTCALLAFEAVRRSTGWTAGDE